MHKLQTIKALHNSYSKISVNAIELKDNTAQILEIALRPPDKALDSSMCKDTRALLQEHYDVFPEKLPHGLLQSHGKTF